MISEQALAELLRETAQAHHRAFEASDGADPEWPSWYAPYLQTRLGDGLGREVTRSELVYLLILAERQQSASGGSEPWPERYARVILAG